MLVLSRRQNDKIILSDRTTGQIIATFTITDIEDRQVQVGIDALPHVGIDREEIYYSKQGFTPAPEIPR